MNDIDDYLRSLVPPRKRHLCFGKLPADEGDENLILECEERPDGTMWAMNLTATSQVAACPFCGFAARIKPVVYDDDGYGGKIPRRRW